MVRELIIFGFVPDFFLPVLLLADCFSKQSLLNWSNAADSRRRIIGNVGHTRVIAVCGEEKEEDAERLTVTAVLISSFHSSSWKNKSAADVGRMK